MVVVNFLRPVLGKAVNLTAAAPPRMTSALVTLDRHSIEHTIQDGLKSTWRIALSRDSQYTLFRSEDLPAWATFTAAFVVLILFDNFVLHRNPKNMTIMRAVCYTLFWIICACSFCGWVYWYYGETQAAMWMSGYMLEWMLSFDNLFVFHLIFSVYATPDHLKHRPLYWGICGAIWFRLAFIFIGEYLVHAMFFMHFIFGAFLVYSGIKMITAEDEDDEDPSQHPLVLWLQKRMPFVNAYDERGAFFVRVPVNDRGEFSLPEGAMKPCPPRTSHEAETGTDGASSMRYGTVDFADAAWVKAGTQQNLKGRGQLRATMLFLVVICLEISDLLFAVDSVSAIVAQVNDLFLAYTSAVFAMLGLRATFFIIDVLVRLFSLLKYGVGAVLVFIGIKLCCDRLYKIPPGVVCFVLVASIAGSMVASWIQDELKKKMEAKQLNATVKANASSSPATCKVH